MLNEALLSGGGKKVGGSGGRRITGKKENAKFLQGKKNSIPYFKGQGVREGKLFSEARKQTPGEENWKMIPWANLDILAVFFLRRS